MDAVQIVFLFNLLFHVTQCLNGPQFLVTSSIPAGRIEITQDKWKVVTFTYKVSDLSVSRDIFMTVCSNAGATNIADSHLSETSVDLWSQHAGNFSLTVNGLFIGRTDIHVYFIFTKRSMGLCEAEGVQCLQEIPQFSLINSTNLFSESRCVYRSDLSVVVTRQRRPVDVAFNIVVVLLVIIVNLGMGCKTELPVVKATLQRPVGPITGFCSQFIIMPLISFAAAYLFEFEPALALGFFALGCAPGGSASNAYVLFLGGDVSLSITMTFISTLASLGMIPLWLFSLGRMLYSSTSIRVPYQNIVFSLLGLVIPVCIGLAIKHKRPGWAKMLVKISKGVMIIFLIFVLTVGVYANIYIFQLMKAQVVVTAAVLPYLGFVLGGLVALVLRMSRQHIITIAVETGIQNTGIAIVLLLLSLEPPESDISIVAPIASALFTPIPVWISIAVLYIRKWWCLKAGGEYMGGDDGKEQEVLHMESPDEALSGSEGRPAQ